MELTRGPRPAARTALLAAVAVALVHFGGYLSATRPIQTDVRYFLYFAERVAAGDLPHLDLFDPKTQLASFAGALFLRLGEALGGDGLSAVRTGFLALAAAGAVLSYAVFRGLAGEAAGWAALFAALAFPIVAVLPAIGNVPKEVLALAIPAVGLALAAGRWRTAGALAALAFLDWQPGGVLFLVVGGAVLAPGSPGGPPRRVRLLRAAGGAGLVLLPYAGLFLVRGGFRDLVRQTLVAPFYRGASSLEGRDLSGRVTRMLELVDSDCPGSAWLFLGGAAAGLAALPLLLRRADPAGRLLLLSMAAAHAGLSAFAFVDFQGHGDFFLLAHAASFLLAVAAALLLSLVRERASTPRSRATLTVGLLLLLALVVRPGPLAPDLPPEVLGGAPALTLDDQREVALNVSRNLEGRRCLWLENAEALFLARGRNLSRHVYWNHQLGAFLGVRRGRELLDRLVEELHPDAVVYYSPERPGSLGSQRRVVSRNGAYEVWVDLLEGGR